MMDPTGQMDCGRLHLHGPNKAEYNVFDLADEEVHFTRNPLPGHPVPITYSYQMQTQADSPTNSIFTDVSLNQELHSSTEQVKSSKLLNTIGSKLRRGSNYLIAPKLVGQYLLGITIRSWSEFLNTSRMLKAPSNTHQLTRRLLNNLSYFQGNYLCVSLVLVIYCILTSPLLLLAIIAYVVALYFATARSATGRQIVIIGYRPNLQQQYSFLTLISLPLLWVAGAPSAVFWVIGASFVVVGLHASMYSGEKQIQEVAGDQIGGRQTQLRTAQVPYYNHYPTSSIQQYISLPSTPARTVDTTTGTSNGFSHWTIFGGSKQYNAGHKLKTSTNKDTNKQPERLPEVTVISQDFAGLGRVYEV